MAGECGLGALSFSLAGPERFAERVHQYYDAFERCVPIGRTVNPNLLATAGNLMCGRTDEEAQAMVGTVGGFFQFGLVHYFVEGGHRPGVTNLWDLYQAKVARDAAEPDGVRPDGGVATVGVAGPARLREIFRGYEEAGADEIMFLLPPVGHE